MQSSDLLIELGTEELPPGSLMNLANAFADEIITQLKDAGLSFHQHYPYATPRRLALRIDQLQLKQPDRDIQRRGPALRAAFDEEGKPTKAAEGFAQSVGMRVDQLDTLETDKGAWLVAELKEQGKTTVELLPAIVSQSLQRLPIPKRMRWGARKAQFVRPVHWLVALLGEETIPMEQLEVTAGRESRGHRFHAPDNFVVSSATAYEQQLEDAFVIANFARRRQMIEQQVNHLGQQAGGVSQIDEALLDEVTALVEWPVALLGHFDQDFLRVPQEALITAMQEHQKYFPVLDAQGKLTNAFITVSNIASKDPQQVINGNEKVIRPRLADAAFFYDNDCRKKLADHATGLSSIIFQQQLGTLADKCERISALASFIAEIIEGDPSLAKTAGQLCKADLTTEMVYEFDTMQGIMGYYLARHEGLHEEIAQALNEQYLPRFAGDHLPSSPTGQALALADKIDTLVGIFGIGQKPSGDKDPYALRRATLGILRIIIERQLPLAIDQLIEKSMSLYGDRIDKQAAGNALDFVQGRYRAFYQEQGIETPVILAVLAVQPAQPLDFDRRIHAVAAFRQRPEAASLAAANKRVANILAKQNNYQIRDMNPDLLQEDEEKTLAQAIERVSNKTGPLAHKGDYAAVLEALTGLRESVDAFFDQVMVMAEDEVLKQNRLALLSRLRQLFLQVADISELG